MPRACRGLLLISSHVHYHFTCSNTGKMKPTRYGKHRQLVDNQDRRSKGQLVLMIQQNSI